VPIVAYAQAAVPSTLGDAGILLKEQNPLLAAGLINELLTNLELRKQVIAKQRARLSCFSYDAIKTQFVFYLTRFLESVK
jgi:glycosyltransferase involved in cell wall biosynthesis